MRRRFLLDADARKDFPTERRIGEDRASEIASSFDLCGSRDSLAHEPGQNRDGSIHRSAAACRRFVFDETPKPVSFSPLKSAQRLL